MYRKMIAEVLVKAERGYSPALVEEIMRCDRPTLDALDRRAFNKLARESVAALDAMTPEERTSFAETFGVK